jgi:ribonucleoside-triphosphate reductase
MAEENANKDTTMASTQRDYIAGITSRDITRRILLPEYISKAHDEGVLHFHK